MIENKYLIRKENLKKRIDELEGIPTLVTIQIRDSRESNFENKELKSVCKEVGIDYIHFELDSFKYSQKGLCDVIKAFSNDEIIDGIVVFSPISKKYNSNELIKYIKPEKDVGMISPNSVYSKIKTIDEKIYHLTILENVIKSYESKVKS